jgi:ABC-type multidrug transport system fused ATPase/permease subunit
VQVADRAVVLDDGRIVEDGTLAELLAREAHFHQLFGDELVAA